MGGVTQNLLGEDFHIKFECNWDYKNGGLRANIPPDDIHSRTTTWISTCESSTILPGHEAVIKSVFHRTEDRIGIPLVSSNFRETYKLVLARTLLDASNDTVYLRVFNPGSSAVTVKADENVAIFSSILRIADGRRKAEAEVDLIPEVDPVSLPDYLVPVYEDGRTHLSDEEALKFKVFLQRRASTFSDPHGERGRTNLGEHSIVLTDNQPFKEASRNIPLFKRDLLDSEIQKLEEMGLIEKSQSPWSSQLVLVQKKDKTWRVCVDYRRLNVRTIKDAYPIPRVDDNLDALSGSTWFTSLDLDLAYHQVPLRECDKEKTAFATPRGGLYQYKVMPFGLCNAPATFQRIIEKALTGLQWNIVVLYLDDLIIFAKSFEETLENLNTVFDRLDNANLKLKAKKCRFFRQEVEFLGHIVFKDEIKTDPQEIEAVKTFLCRKTSPNYVNSLD